MHYSAILPAGELEMWKIYEEVALVIRSFFEKVLSEMFNFSENFPLDSIHFQSEEDIIRLYYGYSTGGIALHIYKYVFPCLLFIGCITSFLGVLALVKLINLVSATYIYLVLLGLY